MSDPVHVDLLGRSALLWDRQFGFLKETLVAPVPRLHIMIGRTLGGATIAMIQGMLVLVVCLIAGFRPHGLAARAAGARCSWRSSPSCSPRSAP